ncbi:MAG: CU044_2847 family protein [Ktedonobacteraceae bacterium]
MDDEIRSLKSKTFVPVRLDEHTIIRIEATPLSDLEPEDEYVSAQSFPSFGEITDRIKGVSKAITEVWEEVKPSKAIVEFGMEIGFEAGKVVALLVQGSGRANFRVTLEWENHTSNPQTHTP